MEGATGGSLRDQIDSLLKMDNGGDVAKAPEIPPFLRIAPMDYESEKNAATEMAKKSMDSLLKFYLKEDIINDNEYIQLRAKIAEAQLSTLIHMIKSSEHAITTLLKQIHAGNFHPRMFEVLAGMQKTLLDMMKMQTMQIIANEESFKRLRADLDSAAPPTAIGMGSGGEGAAVRGTRDLMRSIQNEMAADEIELDDDDEVQ